MNETWKEIIGWPGYEVSNKGRVRCWNPRNRHAYPSREPRILKPTKSRDYFTVKLSNNGERHTFQVHKLVLSHFRGQRPKDMHGRHLDGNSENNDLNNLVWGTVSENQRDRIRHNTHMRGERHVNSKLTINMVKEIKCILKDGGMTYEKMADKFNVSISTISAIKDERNWGWVKV